MQITVAAVRSLAGEERFPEMIYNEKREKVKKKSKEPFVPAERHETVRREIVERLKGQTLSSKDISAAVHIPVKEVYEHLEHIRRSLIKREDHLTVIPAACKKCGFIFKKRERLTKPGKCPVCRSETIEEPLFSLGEKSSNAEQPT